MIHEKTMLKVLQWRLSLPLQFFGLVSHFILTKNKIVAHQNDPYFVSKSNNNNNNKSLIFERKDAFNWKVKLIVANICSVL